MTDNEMVIYRLCNENDWFTGGDNQAYGKLFKLAKNYMPASIIAYCIWMVSDDTYMDIYNTIKKSDYTEK